jgi:hypothetical protein
LGATVGKLAQTTTEVAGAIVVVTPEQKVEWARWKLLASTSTFPLHSDDSREYGPQIVELVKAIRESGGGRRRPGCSNADRTGLAAPPPLGLIPTESELPEDGGARPGA